MALFEGYERRIDKINAALTEYGINDLDEARQMCTEAGVDVYTIVKEVQPICF
ncbi:MAG: GGGtGRT protein, partial [Candidatus Electrothrix sp. AR4]|nr:GGGtGRT protein [Candidatus Electrothrix sp. AR4]